MCNGLMDVWITSTCHANALRKLGQRARKELQGECAGWEGTFWMFHYGGEVTLCSKHSRLVLGSQDKQRERCTEFCSLTALYT